VNLALSDFTTSNSLHTLAYFGIEMYFWSIFANISWWNYIRYVGRAILAYNFGLFALWIAFLNSNGASGTFVSLFETTK